jgi:hypothetical protein
MAGMAATSQARVVSFGTGGNQFQIEFVTIGNPNNAADTTGAPNPAGAVGYEYGIGKFEVSEDMITKFNASQSLQITMDSRGTNKPATSVSWNEAARFVNWLNTSTGGFAAYKFTTSGVNDNIALWTTADTLDYQAANPYRSKRATYVLPSYNEWYTPANGSARFESQLRLASRSHCRLSEIRLVADLPLVSSFAGIIDWNCIIDLDSALSFTMLATTHFPTKN